MQEHFYAVLQQKRVFRKENGSGSAPRDKNLIFVHFDVIIPSEASLLARACERHISTEKAVCGTQSAGQRKLTIKFQFYLVSMLFINDRFIINCFFNYPNLYTKISPRKFAGIKNYLLSSSVSSADYDQQMKKLHYRNGESRNICHGGG